MARKHERRGGMQYAFSAKPAERASSSAAVLFGAGVLLCSQAPAGAAPPLPRGTLPVPQANFVASGQASIATAGTTMNVNQASQKAILNWQTFNISQDAAVRFNQPNASSVTLNRIADANPAAFGFNGSIIQGQLSANGQIYLINRNGILFGAGAQVNVNTLIATSLDIPDQRFTEGLLSRPDFGPVFEDVSGLAGAVIVDVGARVDSAKGGRVLLLAPHVENRGRIATPDGQTVLAAGNKIYLRNSTDPNLRGFLVEVDTGLAAPDSAKAAVNLGEIVAERGNITMVGLAVKQGGIATATTAVTANGSIRLVARDTNALADPRDVTSQLNQLRGGSVQLAAGSVTQVLPDTADTATIDANVAFSRSNVHVEGRLIVHEGAIKAPFGTVDFIAQADPHVQSRDTPTDARIYLANGSSIDVSGTRDTVLPASSNQLTVELRGDELKDFPLQRDGVLRGKKVTIEVDRGTTVADVSKQIAAIPKGIGEIAATGGAVSLTSDGDIAMQQAARIDVSGGQIAHEAGFIDTTKLVSNGKLYDIAIASPDRVYDGIVTAGQYTVLDRKWNVTRTFDMGMALRQQTPAYVSGAAAGSVSFQAHGLAIDGVLAGAVVQGPRQREAGQPPVAGGLTIGDFLNVGNATPATHTHDVVLRNASAPTAPAASNAPLNSAAPLVLSTEFLSRGGFSRFTLDRNGAIEVPAGVDLAVAPGGSISLTGASLSVMSNITAPAGSIALATRNVPNQPIGSLVVGADSTLSARGLWVNDTPGVAGAGALGPTLINGGSISINSSSDLRLGAVSGNGVNPTVLDVTGGAWTTDTGAFRAGNGGSITLGSAGGTLQLAATLKGLAPGAGGKLTVTGNQVVIRPGTPLMTAEGATLQPGDIARTGTTLTLPDWMFDTLGFTSFNVQGTGLSVAPGTQLDLAAPYLAFGADRSSYASGADVLSFARTEALPETRRPASLTLAHFGRQNESVLQIGQSARIATDPGAAVTLSTEASMVIDGSIDAPAGAITLNLIARSSAAKAQSYSASQSIWLGAESSLSAAGAVRLTPDPLGRRSGSVLDGGSVNIVADRGYVVTEAGSRIDVSGAETGLDLRQADGGYQRTGVASHGGSISITAAEGMLLDGALIARPGGAGATGGALALSMTTINRGNDPVENPFPSVDRVLALRDGVAAVLPAGLRAGAPIQRQSADDLNGLAYFNVARLAEGGFTQFTAKSNQAVRFDGNLSVAVSRSIVLDAPSIDLRNHEVALAASMIALGASDPNYQTAPAASTGTGSLSATADLIELVGHTALGQSAHATLGSRGDLRARAVQDLVSNHLTGRFATAGALELNAAQVYPTTLSEFAISSGGTLSVTSAASAAAPPLSAGGSLALAAPDIVVTGTLRAPFGTLDLSATGTLVLGPSSVTSVSGAGLLVPFGNTQNGSDWVYSPAAGINLLISEPPQKAVRLNGRSVTLAAGATVDLSGGGDLYAYEFVPGPGGSRDAVANVVDGKSSGLYAVVPGLGATYAPFDQQYYADSSLKPGDSVYLAGGGGLAAGTYALLPARYALLPGAYLVKAVSGFGGVVPGRNAAQLDGVPVTAGFRTWAGNDAMDNRWTAFSVQPGAAARTLAEYRDTYATPFFTQRAQDSGAVASQMPGDAGRLAISVSESLALAGAKLQTARAQGARGAEFDLSGAKLAVTSPDAVDLTGLDGYVRVSAADINRLDAESVLLGGTRLSGPEGVEVRVGASDVVIATSAAVALRAPEIMAAASGTLTVRSGSVVEGTGASGTRPGKISIGYRFDAAKPVTDAAQISRRDVNRDGIVNAADDIDGRGAFLRASGADQVVLARGNVADRNRGTVTIEAGARVEADKSLMIDATADTAVRSGARIGAGAVRDTNGDGVVDASDHRVGGAMSLAAGLISAGATQSANGGAGVSRGLVLSDALLAQLGDAGDLALRSYSTVDLYGATALGGSDAATGAPRLGNLEIDAAGIAGYANAGATSVITAKTLRLSNSGAALFAGTPDGSGRLQLAAARIVLGVGDKTVRGFGDVVVSATGEITSEGVGAMQTAGALALQAPRITAAPAAVQSIRAVDARDPAAPVYFDVTITSAAAATPPAAAASVGARLAIEGASVVQQGVIDLPGGRVDLTAWGAGGDVRLADGARISTRGYSRALADQTVEIPGGEVRLVSDRGNVVIGAASIDVGSATGDAGRLVVSAANGVAAVSGTLSGAAPSSHAGASFSLDARVVNADVTQSVNDFSALNSRLNTGGFTAARDFRIRSGDVSVGAQDRVAAHTVSLAADAGRVDVLGIIDASGASGGDISLMARGDVRLAAGASLIARASAEGGNGGTVTLASTSGAVNLAAGSIVDASKFTYRAADVNVAAAAGGANAYTAAFAAAPAAYVKGMTVVFAPVAGSSGSSTLAINGLAPVAIKRSDGTDVTDVTDDIRSGEIVKLTYDGTYFRLPAGRDGSVLLRAQRNGAANDVPITALGEIRGAREIVAEGYKAYTAANITNAGVDGPDNLNVAVGGAVFNDAAAFVDAANVNAGGVRSRLSASAAARFSLRPGVEIRSPGDLRVAVGGSGWDLSQWRFGGAPGVLTLRAGGNVTVASSIGDGFDSGAGAMQNWTTLRADDSWSYRITSGADLAAASPFAVQPLAGAAALQAASGSVVVNANVLVRTGTGTIDVSAGRDFVLGYTGGENAPSAALYTAGRQSQTFPTSGPDGFPTTNLTTARYPTNGGDVSIAAQRDVLGAKTRQLVTEWLVRRGQTNAATGAIVANRNTAWGVNFAKFQQNVGTLGGGNVSVNAGRNIDNLSVVAPTTGRLLGAAGTMPDANKLVVTGGGNIDVSAGDDIRSGLFYVGRGTGTVRAGGSIVAGRTVAVTNPNAVAALTSPVHTVLALGDGRFDVRAAGSVTIETVLNPTAVPQDSTVLSSNRTYFYTYSPSAAASIGSLSGSVVLQNDPEALRNSAGNIPFGVAPNTGDPNTLFVYPGKLAAYAPYGDIRVGSSFTLFPAPTGNLELIAGRDVKLDVNADTSRRVINLSDADPALLLNPLRVPVAGLTVVYQDTDNRLDPRSLASLSRALTPVHQGDTEPVRIIASEGSISGGSLFLAKRAELTAGLDIRDVALEAQNLSATDITLLAAGRDIAFATPRDILTGVQLENSGGIALGGPGRLALEAGRNIDLGNSKGIVTRANIANPALPPQGADIAVAAGISAPPDYSAFISRYFDASGKQQVAQYVRTKLNNPGLTDEQAIKAFDDLGKTRQLAAPFMPVLRQIFYAELKQAGREAVIPGGNYQRGFSAIGTLFPGASYKGDLSLLFSQIKTESGGSIDLLVPGGLVNAGQTTPPAQSGSTKSADQLGLLVFDTGAVHAFSKGDFAVNESRVFTLKGGDILIWSSEGNIDAGRGAKTAVSAPAPIQVTDANGNTTLKFLSVSGSGIRSILTSKDIKPGDVDLIAPVGEVNAGDAGIGAAGNINIAAVRVVGADNIQVGGQASGVPLGDAGGAGRGLTGVSNVASDATKAAEQATRALGTTATTPAFRPSFINVEVIGLGEP